MSKEITMSINQFMEIERGNLTLEELHENKLLKALKNENVQRCIVGTTTYLILMSMPTLAVGGQALESAIPVLNSHVAETITNNTVYIVFGTTCAFETIKALVTKKFNDLPKIAVKYTVIIGFVYGMNKLLQTLENTANYLVYTFGDGSTEPELLSNISKWR